jgi:mono/diheme cytochrome c family protein
MGSSARRRIPGLGAISLGAIVLALAVWGVTGGDAQTPRGRAARQNSPGAHGDPPGWRFTLPSGGDAARGRAVFERSECYKCHEVKGERFPVPSQRDAIGPELGSMAGHHSAGFLAESIVNPGAFIDKGRGYTAQDGTSKMPSFNDSMTIQDLVDVVAFLKRLSPSAAPATGGHRH